MYESLAMNTNCMSSGCFYMNLTYYLKFYKLNESALIFKHMLFCMKKAMGIDLQNCESVHATHIA